MTTFVPPKTATEFIFYVTLRSQADTKLLITNPTIAAGDFTVSTDGGAFSNLDTIPAVTPASGAAVKVTLSVAEMTGANVLVLWEDAAGAEWVSGYAIIQTSAAQIDDLVTNVWAATTRTLTQSAPSVNAAVSGGSIVDIRGDEWAISLTGLGDVSANKTETYFTIKDNLSKSDANAKVKISENNGLQILNASTSVTAGNASFTWTNTTTGAATIMMKAVDTAQLTPAAYFFDVQVQRSTGTETQTLTSGTFTLTGDVTRATSS